MATLYEQERSSLGDVWCRGCHRASRFGQWVPGGDACPHCGAAGSMRLPWILLRVRFPFLPFCPIFGQVYDPALFK